MRAARSAQVNRCGHWLNQLLLFCAVLCISVSIPAHTPAHIHRRPSASPAHSLSPNIHIRNSNHHLLLSLALLQLISSSPFFFYFCTSPLPHSPFFFFFRGLSNSFKHSSLSSENRWRAPTTCQPAPRYIRARKHRPLTAQPPPPPPAHHSTGAHALQKPAPHKQPDNTNTHAISHGPALLPQFTHGAHLEPETLSALSVRPLVSSLPASDAPPVVRPSPRAQPAAARENLALRRSLRPTRCQFSALA